MNKRELLLRVIS